MPPDVPPEVRVVESPDGVSYHFPRRAEYWGVFFLPFVLVAPWWVLLFGLSDWRLANALANVLTNTLTIALGAVLCWTTLYYLGVLLYAYAGRSEVRLAGGELVAVERVGPLARSRRRPVGRVRRLVVGHPPPGGGDWAGRAEEPDRGVILAECDGGDPLRLAPGYPRGWLLAVADGLTRRMAAAAADEQPAAPPAAPPAAEVSAVLPPGLQVTESPDGVCYRFPRREEKWVGAVIPLFTFLTPFWGCAVWFFDWWSGSLFLWLFVAVAGLSTLIYVWFLLYHCAGRSEVRLAGGELVAAERAGPFTWSRRRPAARVTRLVVGLPPGRGPDWAGADQPGRGVILAECGDDAPLRLAAGYPHDWLLAVARDLTARMGAAAPVSGAARPVVAESVVMPGGYAERPTQPRGSQVRVEHHPDGVTLDVPPPGLRGRGVSNALTFGLVFTAFPIVFMAVVVASMIGAPGWQGDEWIGLLFAGALCTVFASIGLSCLAYARHLARRRAVLSVVGDVLLVRTARLFGPREGRWRRDELTDVRVGPSGQAVNDEPILELQVHPATGKVFGLLVWRDEDELVWMATVLRRALRLPAGRADPVRVSPDWAD